jgi:predicted dinucleotide-binding enzyme
MFEALIAVIPEPDPAMFAVIVLAEKLPPESRATIVEAPLAESAVVRALATVPEEMLDALIPVSADPSPDILVKAPVVAETLVELTSVAVTTLAANEPLVSRATIVEAPLAEAAVVLAFEIVPLVIFEALMFVSVEPLPAMFAIKVPTTVTFAGKLAFWLVSIVKAVVVPLV